MCARIILPRISSDLDNSEAHMGVTEIRNEEVRSTVDRRLTIAGHYLIDAVRWTKRYLARGCDAYTNDSDGYCSRAPEPPELERARVKIMSAAVNCETALMWLLDMSPVNSSLARSEASRVTARKDRRGLVQWILMLLSLLDDAAKRCLDVEIEYKRVRRRAKSDDVLDIVNEALDVVVKLVS